MSVSGAGVQFIEIMGGKGAGTAGEEFFRLYPIPHNISRSGLGGSSGGARSAGSIWVQNHQPVGSVELRRPRMRRHARIG